MKPKNLAVLCKSDYEQKHGDGMEIEKMAIVRRGWNSEILNPANFRHAITLKSKRLLEWLVSGSTLNSEKAVE